MLIFSKKDLELEKAKEKEWIITNGLGSYSSSTIIGLNTRKYHGLLVAALEKPLGRHLLLSKFEEDIKIDGKTFNLSVNEYKDKIYNPDGYKYLKSFVNNIYPVFHYKIENIDIIKSICMVNKHNAVVVSYKIISDKEFEFLLRPLVNFRDFHGNTKEHQQSFTQTPSTKTTVIRPSHGLLPAIIIGSDSAEYKQKEFWVYNMQYEKDKIRGYNCLDDHYCPGEFSVDIKKGINRINFLVVGDRVDEAYESFDNLYSIDYKEYEKFFDYETKRIKSLISLCYNFNKIKEDPLLPYLIHASDSFIVENENNKSIIAGYHWFDDWGRDSLISITGLCLATGRINYAKEILIHYAKNCKNGLIPNIINNKKNYYNSIDSSLWFIYSVYKFYKYTNNLDFIKENLWEKIKEIVSFYKIGTDFSISMKKDGLISSEIETPLTWMDTKYTIRKGKCVEINALWYNALKITELFAKRFNEDFEEYLVMSNMCKDSFNKIFWNEKQQCLYDVVDNNIFDDSIRPNQIFAVSLPFKILDTKREYLVVKKVTEELLTPVGLRTLSKNDKKYAGFYYGNEEERDRAYHNGTVWGWLLGPYITAYLKIHNYSAKGKNEANKKILKNIHLNLREHGIGTISEIYDGNYPHKPRGCISQAWSVAEIIRSYIEDIIIK